MRNAIRIAPLEWLDQLRRVHGTVRHLRWDQLARLAVRRGLRWRPAVRMRTSPEPRIGVNLAPTLRRSRQTARWSFTFLNESRVFQSGCVDWRCRDASRLWRYNLHYFDFIDEPVYSDADRRLLIDDWIHRNPVGEGDGWDPYPVSLRIVNWVKLFVRDEWRGRVPREWLDCLAGQATWLERNLEHDLLANHLFKNIKALLFAGTYFRGPGAELWLRTGERLLARELREQFLGDGGHFERSPMYHLIVTEDCLDLINLAAHSSPALAPETLRLLHATTQRALRFAAKMQMPDGDIPLFNDSALGIAPRADELLAHACEVLGEESVAASSGADRALQDSGYFIIESERDRLIVDCGAVGPDYQPGHAHCDTLSYELAVCGHRFVVDAGVHDYADSEHRRYARSTAAHNTVVIDGREQSDVWGVFRVARRARPVRASLGRDAGGTSVFEGAHDGYLGAPSRALHVRRIACSRSGEWEISDRIEGKGAARREAASYVHIHPAWRLTTQSGASVNFLHEASGVRAEVIHDAALRPHVGEGWYYPEFGIAKRSHVLRFDAHGPPPLALAYRIRSIAPTG